jgi:hypothetical protein
MGKRTIRAGAAILVVLAGLFATVGEGSTGSSGDSGNRAPNAQSSSDSTAPGDAKADDGAGKEGADKAKPISVGTQIKVSSGWDFKVNSVNQNANEQLAQANEFNTPEDGKQFVLVNVTMINKSGKPDAPLTNLKMSLLPPSGVAIDSSWSTAGLGDACDTTTQLQPDAEYTCNAVFEAKPDEVGNSLLLVEPQFTLDENGAQRFFALA